MPNFSGPYPYSAPRPRSLPTYDPTQDDATVFANWNSQLADSVRNAAPQATPLNFAVTNGTNQLTLNWGAVSGSDGYEILKSPSGSFSTDLQIIPVKNANQTSYVDNTVTGGAQCFYRIRTTSGTKQNPQSQRGPESGVVSHTAISSTSSQTATTKLDQFTTDSSRAGARKGNYGAFKQANTGTLTRVTGAGQKSGAASGASGPAAGTKSSGMKSIASASTSSSSSGGGSGGGGSSPSSTPFSSISSGVNNTAVMQVGNGGQIIPNASNPGVIEATEAPWSGLFGDLFAGQYIPFDNTATVGTPATTISQVVNGVLGIGTGVAPATSTSGGLVLTTATVLGIQSRFAHRNYHNLDGHHGHYRGHDKYCGDDHDRHRPDSRSPYGHHHRGDDHDGNYHDHGIYHGHGNQFPPRRIVGGNIHGVRQLGFPGSIGPGLHDFDNRLATMGGLLRTNKPDDHHRGHDL